MTGQRNAASAIAANRRLQPELENCDVWELTGNRKIPLRSKLEPGHREVTHFFSVLLGEYCRIPPLFSQLVRKRREGRGQAQAFLCRKSRCSVISSGEEEVSKISPLGFSAISHMHKDRYRPCVFFVHFAL